MSTAQQGTTAAPQVPPLVAAVKGRVFAARRIQTKNGPQVITILKLAAPDEYSSPQTIELRSAQRLADNGQDWSGRVRIGGYGRQYQATDPETGEKRTVQTADNSLTVIEG
jgi:hypothetical protein